MGAANCTAHTAVSANPDIAGIGVMISFIAAFAASFIISIVILTLEALNQPDEVQESAILSLMDRWLPNDHNTLERWTLIFRQLLLGFSDQHILFALSIQIIGIMKIDSIPIYYARIISTLATLSTSAYILSVLVLQKYFLNNRWMGICRLILLTICIGLLLPAMLVESSIVAKWKLRSTGEDISASAPAICIIHGKMIFDGSGLIMFGNCMFYGLAFIVSLLTLAGSVIRNPPKWVSYWTTGWNRALIILLVPGVSVSFYSTLHDTQLFGSPPVEVIGNEGEWGFGQILPLMFLALPVLNVLQFLSEEETKYTLADIEPESGSVSLGESSIGGSDGQDDHSETGSIVLQQIPAVLIPDTA
ncbi:hypothetical protein N7540_000427 [Penicillium herquei]|nr:hypothetical protein N7540_000427 [Penicillium herquei]